MVARKSKNKDILSDERILVEPGKIL